MNSRNLPTSNGLTRGERALLAVFPASVEIIEPLSGQDSGLVVNGHAIGVKWVGQGHLGDVRPVINDRPGEDVVLVARHMSPGARKALSEGGLNWADESGAAEISIGPIVISRTGSPKKVDKTIKRWSPAVISVAEALLCGTHGTQSATQAATGLSAGSCTNALHFLSEQTLVESKAKRGPASARYVTNPRALLTAYAEAVAGQPPDIEVQIGVTWQDMISGMAELGHHFDSRATDWAVTGTAAAAIIAPYLSSVARVTVYVDAQSIAELQALASSAKLRPIQDGRLMLKPFPTGAVQHLSNVIDGLHIAPWPRVYADLLGEGVRGEEAAEHLFEVVHGR
jgi:hypothetical protein